jgi:hypothetical protein
MRRWRSWGHDNRLIAVGAAFMLVYTVVLAQKGTEKPETFPFTSWSLFSKVPDREGTDYSLRFTSANGAGLAEPVYFEDAEALRLPTDAPAAIEVIQQLGRHLAGDRQDQVATTRALLESKYLTAVDRADYEVVRRRYDRLERYECDCFSQVDVLDRFSLSR